MSAFTSIPSAVLSYIYAHPFFKSVCNVLFRYSMGQGCAPYVRFGIILGDLGVERKGVSNRKRHSSWCALVV